MRQNDGAKNEEPDFIKGTWANLSKEYDKIKKQYIIGLLKKYNGKVLKAVYHSGISRQNFSKYAKKFGIVPQDYR